MYLCAFPNMFPNLFPVPDDYWPAKTIAAPGPAISACYRNQPAAKYHHACQNTDGLLIMWLPWIIAILGTANPYVRSPISPYGFGSNQVTAASYRQRVVKTQFSALLWMPQWTKSHKNLISPMKGCAKRWTAGTLPFLSLQKRFVLITFL